MTTEKKTEDLCRHKAYWDCIHRLALYEKNKELFPQFMIFLSDRYWCGTCRPHIKKYITDLPPDKLKPDFNGDIDLAAFKYTVDMRNSVSSRLGKKIAYKAEDVLPLYLENSVVATCVSGCGDEGSNIEPAIHVEVTERKTKYQNM